MAVSLLLAAAALWHQLLAGGSGGSGGSSCGTSFSAALAGYAGGGDAGDGDGGGGEPGGLTMWREGACGWLALGAGSLLLSLAEAGTTQIDNLTLPVLGSLTAMLSSLACSCSCGCSSRVTGTGAAE